MSHVFRTSPLYNDERLNDIVKREKMKLRIPVLKDLTAKNAS